MTSKQLLAIYAAAIALGTLTVFTGCAGLDLGQLQDTYTAQARYTSTGGDVHLLVSRDEAVPSENLQDLPMNAFPEGQSFEVCVTNNHAMAGNFGDNNWCNRSFLINPMTIAWQTLNNANTDPHYVYLYSSAEPAGTPVTGTFRIGLRNDLTNTTISEQTFEVDFVSGELVHVATVWRTTAQIHQ